MAPTSSSRRRRASWSPAAAGVAGARCSAAINAPSATNPGSTRGARRHAFAPSSSIRSTAGAGSGVPSSSAAKPRRCAPGSGSSSSWRPCPASGCTVPVAIGPEHRSSTRCQKSSASVSCRCARACQLPEGPWSRLQCAPGPVHRRRACMNRRDFLESVSALTLAAAGTAAAETAAGLSGSGFDPTEKSIAELSRAQAEGHVSAEGLTRSYLARIDQYDRKGPRLGAVLALNPEALSAARALDAARRAGKLQGPLHGIPMLLKDNIETRDPLPTTAGSLALASARHSEDAPMAARLRAAGCIVIGKANLTEWANFRSTRSVSGWSGVGGQTLCPYNLRRNPSGSSAGPAAGTTANLCAAAIGSETDGSILAPASINGLVGLKPTVGLVSGVGVVPITARQDITGPMTRTVADAALLMAVIAQPGVQWDGIQPLAQMPKGLRLGVLPPPASTHPEVVRQSHDWLKLLEHEGFSLVDVAPPPAWATVWDDAEIEVLLYDFKADLNAYLARFKGALAVRTLADIIEFNKQHAAQEMPIFGQELFEQAEARGPRTSPAYLQALHHLEDVADTSGLAAVFAKHKVDALVAPGNGPAELIDDVWGDRYENSGGWPTMCSAAAVAGYPSLTVPAGFVDGLPVGIHFVAPRFREGRLLQIGRAFERARNARRPPQLDARA